MTNRLDKLLEKQEQLSNRIKAEQTKLRTRERKLDTRRKILLGSLVQAMMEKDESLRDDLNRRLETFLTRRLDREAFGIAGGDEPSEASEEKDKKDEASAA